MKASWQALTIVFLFFILSVCVLSYLSTSAEGATGWQIDLFCQYGGLGKNVECPALIYVGARIILFASVTYNGLPVQSILVAFQVDKPNGSQLLIAVQQTNASGIATTSFTITANSYPIFPSTWNSTATTSPAQKTVSDSMLFQILPLRPVGGLSLTTPNSTVNLDTRAMIAEVLIASGLIVSAKFRKDQNRHINIS